MRRSTPGTHTSATAWRRQSRDCHAQPPPTKKIPLWPLLPSSLSSLLLCPLPTTQLLHNIKIRASFQGGLSLSPSPLRNSENPFKKTQKTSKKPVCLTTPRPTSFVNHPPSRCLSTTSDPSLSCTPRVEKEQPPASCSFPWTVEIRLTDCISSPIRLYEVKPRARRPPLTGTALQRPS